MIRKILLTVSGIVVLGAVIVGIGTGADRESGIGLLGMLVIGFVVLVVIGFIVRIARTTGPGKFRRGLAPLADAGVAYQSLVLGNTALRPEIRTRDEELLPTSWFTEQLPLPDPELESH